MSQHPRAILVLEDGTVFHGISVGVEGITTGEVAFNTAMTGYSCAYSRSSRRGTPVCVQGGR